MLKLSTITFDKLIYCAEHVSNVEKYLGQCLIVGSVGSTEYLPAQRFFMFINAIFRKMIIIN